MLIEQSVRSAVRLLVGVYGVLPAHALKLSAMTKRHVKYFLVYLQTRRDSNLGLQTLVFFKVN